MLKKIMFAFCTFAATCVSYQTFIVLSKPMMHCKQEPITAQDKQHILLTCLATGFGGAEEHFLRLVLMLQENLYPVTVLVAHNTPLSKQLQEKNIPHYTTRAALFCNNIRYLHHYFLKKCMQALYQQNNYDVIHCNDCTEVQAARAIAQAYPVRVILTRHVPTPLKPEKIRDLYAVVGVNPRIADYIEQENKSRSLNIKHIVSIPPLYNQERCLSYQPTGNRQDFYKDTFNITVTNAPIVAMIANFYSDLNHKNHPLLIAALDELINKEHKHVQVMLAGDGPSRKLIEKLVTEKNLTAHVHFLGHTSQIPGLLYHSDIMVLTSKKEALGIVYLEAGIMSKPAIGAYGTGAETIIANKQTGLLFKNNDVADLARCIRQLIDDPELAQQHGERAHRRILENFAPEILFREYEKLYLAKSYSRNAAPALAGYP